MKTKKKGFDKEYAMFLILKLIDSEDKFTRTVIAKMIFEELENLK